MSKGAKFGTIMLLALPLTCLAGEQAGQQKLSCIKDFTFSQEFLAKHPRAGAACREVEMRDGTKWVRFEAEITKVQQHQLTANFLDNFNNTVATLVLEASPEASLQVNGRETRYRDLKSGDRLTVWMPENKVGYYAEPGALKNERLSVVSDQTAQR